MIPRYESKNISHLWKEETKFKFYLDIELALLSALEFKQIIPDGISQKFSSKAEIKLDRIHDIEKIVGHDVIAFTTSISENFPPEVSKFFHYGATSSDIIDTALSMQIRESLKIIFKSYHQLYNDLWSLAIQEKNTLIMGRSHGMNAEPMSFGQKLLGHVSEFHRRYVDLIYFYNSELTLQMSGAVGNYTILTPEIENIMAEKLNLTVEPVSTQVIPRDRIAKLISITAQMANALERLAIEIRHLSISDIGEVAEAFHVGQKGSSTMPHKKNPIAAENISGLCRFLKSHNHIAMENTQLWFERDISHSSAERLYLPDHFGILDYVINRMSKTIQNLVINRQVMRDKIDQNPQILSSYLLHTLIPLTAKLSRETLYSAIQNASFTLKAGESLIDGLQQLLLEKYPTETTAIAFLKNAPKEIDFHFCRHTDGIFSRMEKIRIKSVPV